MTRSRRTLSAYVVLISLLVSQWALASYVCAMPMPGSGHAVAPMASTGPAGHCDDEVPRSTLCVKHCGNDQAADASDSPLTTPLWVSIHPVVLWSQAIATQGGAGIRAPGRTDPLQTSPPPLLLSRRLRI